MKFNLSELVKIVNGYAFKSADIVSDQSVYVIKIKNIQSSKILLEKDSMTAEVDGLNKYGADVKIMDRLFWHREVPHSENFSKPGFQLKTA